MVLAGGGPHPRVPSSARSYLVLGVYHRGSRPVCTRERCKHLREIEENGLWEADQSWEWGIDGRVTASGASL
eukprot:5580458-Pyramimonas_sp.AAC.2